MVARTIVLNQNEIKILMRQDPSTASDGGYQSLLIKLQNQLNRDTGAITLYADDLRRIPEYAYCYGQGGWQDRLEAIFARTLGPKLGRASES